MARKRVSNRRSAGGLELLLSGFATLIVAIGAVAAMASIVIWGPSGLLPTIGILIGTAFTWLILRFCAEIIRLQKKSVGIPYSGEISQATETIVHTCSDCGALLHSESRCDACGAEIESD